MNKEFAQLSKKYLIKHFLMINLINYANSFHNAIKLFEARFILENIL